MTKTITLTDTDRREILDTMYQFACKHKGVVCFNDLQSDEDKYNYVLLAGFRFAEAMMKPFLKRFDFAKQWADKAKEGDYIFYTGHTMRVRD